MSGALAPELIERVRARAEDPVRRSDAASLVAGTMPLDALLSRLGGSDPQLQRLSDMLAGLGGLMKGMNVVGPGTAPPRQAEPLPPVATKEQIEAAEQAIGRALPTELSQLYAGIADGGFGPGGGLLPLARVVREYVDLTGEPAGPQNQPWPEALLPISDNEPGYDCVDMETGKVIAWDPQDMDYSEAGWRRSFAEVAPSIADWLEQWLSRPTAAERMRQ